MIFKSVAAAAALASSFLASSVAAQLDLRFQNNTVVYWGQNAAYQTFGTGYQKDLLTTCSDAAIDVVVISFVTKFKGRDGYPVLNLSDQCGLVFKNATTGRDTDILNCPWIGEHITKCQAMGKKILLSLGGATYTEPGWPTIEAARAAANTIWGMFGVPDKNKPVPYRPFGDAVVDGFDLDFEFAANKPNTRYFAALLVGKYGLFKSRKFYLTAAPQCPIPDAALDEALRFVPFDAVFIQFYNNACQLNTQWTATSTTNAYNFKQWQTWATTQSNNKSIKLFIGMLGANYVGTTGYIARTKAREFLTEAKKSPNFAGVSFWDISGLNTNDQYLNALRLHLGGKTGVTPQPTTTTTTTSTTTTSSIATTTPHVTTTLSTSTTTTTTSQAATSAAASIPKRALKEYVGGGVQFPDEEPAGVEAKALESLNKFRRRHTHHRRNY